MQCSKGDELNAPPSNGSRGFRVACYIWLAQRTVSRTLVAVSNAPTVAIDTESRVRVPFLRTKDAHTANHGLTDAIPMGTSSQRDGVYNSSAASSAAAYTA